jgi:molybdenum cofactor guanylyltransferase
MIVHHNFGAPVLALCGFSGSGKTTLLESAIPHLVAIGLAIAVVKHDAHGLSIDRLGKDSDRFFRAGATVALRGPSEQAQRRGSFASLTLESTLADLARDHDLILVEGHKDTKLPKLWLSGKENSPPPAEVTDVLQILPWDSERLPLFLKFIDGWLVQAHNLQPLYGGLLVGGKSARMGSPKQLLEFKGRTLAEIAITALSSVLNRGSSNSAEDDDASDRRLAILGAGPIPSSLQNIARLPDPPGLVGPLAGLLAAHRWNPRAAWILAACDHPWLDQSDVQFLVDERKPGTWAIMPRQPDGHPYPTFALFEPQSLQVLERSVLVRGPENVRIAELFDHPRTLIVPHAKRALFNANTPAQFKTASELNDEDARSSQKEP